jgi:glycogen debranching enzyme
MLHHITSYGLGSIGEIFDGDPPFTPRGSIAQAWSVAEVLRAWKLTEENSNTDDAD